MATRHYRLTTIDAQGLRHAADPAQAEMVTVCGRGYLYLMEVRGNKFVEVKQEQVCPRCWPRYIGPVAMLMEFMKLDLDDIADVRQALTGLEEKLLRERGRANARAARGELSDEALLTDRLKTAVP